MVTREEYNAKPEASQLSEVGSAGASLRLLPPSTHQVKMAKIEFYTSLLAFIGTSIYRPAELDAVAAERKNVQEYITGKLQEVLAAK